jgi:peptide-methionine (S)-S-oxide reductase
VTKQTELTGMLRRLARMMAGFAVAAGLLLGAALPSPVAAAPVPTDDSTAQKEGDKMAIATFGGGCFWCVEAAMEQLEGVSEAVSGYEGGHVENPTYEQVCGKRTGHVEVCQIHFDPEKISYEELLEVFFKIHDPTTKNRQGNDVGPQYRSVIFYHTDEQRKAAKQYIAKLEDADVFRRRIVTDVEPTKTFYKAEEYHQDYFEKNPFAGYCQVVVRPKVEKVQQEFGDKVKSDK